MTDIKEARGLEVVAWIDPSDMNRMENHGYKSCVVKADKAPCYTEPLCRLSDATAVIDQQARRIELLDEANRQLRDRVAELGAMLKIATNEREVAEINAEHWLNNLKNTQEKAREDRATHRAELAALKSAPVVMPEWATSSEALGQRLLDAGWRDYADAQWDGVKEIFAELNRSKT